MPGVDSATKSCTMETLPGKDIPMAEENSRKQFPLCPICESDNVYRSRRNGLIEWVLHHLLFKSPYRCQDCNERFFRSRLARRHPPKELRHRPV